MEELLVCSESTLNCNFARPFVLKIDHFSITCKLVLFRGVVNTVENLKVAEAAGTLCIVQEGKLHDVVFDIP